MCQDVRLHRLVPCLPRRANPAFHARMLREVQRTAEKHRSQSSGTPRHCPQGWGTFWHGLQGRSTHAMMSGVAPCERGQVGQRWPTPAVRSSERMTAPTDTRVRSPLAIGAGPGIIQVACPHPRTCSREPVGD